MKVKKLCSALLSLLFIALFLTGCKPELPESNGTNPCKDNGEESRRTYAVVFPIVHPFFEPVGRDAEEFGKEYGWDVIIRSPREADARLQIEIMEELIEMGVDGIAIGPTDPEELVEVINKALDAGIKVICFETDAPESGRMGYVGTNNYNAGRHMGYIIGKALGEEGKILILTGLSTQMSLNERIRGIKSFLSVKYPDIQVLDIQSSEGDAQNAVNIAKSMIEEHPDFDALIGIDATAGPAAIIVWKEKGLKNTDKMIITFDDMPDNLRGMRDGYIESIVSQRQDKWGQGVLLLLNSLVEGRPIPDYTDTGSIEITLFNIDRYQNEPSWAEPR